MCKVLLEAAEFPDETWAPVVHARFLDDRAQVGPFTSLGLDFPFFTPEITSPG